MNDPICQKCRHYDAAEIIEWCRRNQHPDGIGTTWVARLDPKMCGPDARWFEPMPPKRSLLTRLLDWVFA